MIEKALHWNARSYEYDGAAKDLRVGMINRSCFHYANLW